MLFGIDLVKLGKIIGSIGIVLVYYYFEGGFI